MSAMIAARDRRAWSGGKGRVCGPAADDADGPQELDPVGVDVGFGGRPADQRRDGVVGEQVAVDLLADHGGALGPQYRTGAAQAGFELVVAGFLLPPLAVSPGQFLSGRQRGVGDGGDQGDQLAAAIAVAVGDLVFDDPHPHRLALVEMLARGRRRSACSGPCRAGWAWPRARYRSRRAAGPAPAAAGRLSPATAARRRSRRPASPASYRNRGRRSAASPPATARTCGGPGPAPLRPSRPPGPSAPRPSAA